MRALTLLEPWATLVVRGLKTVETRGRPVGLTVGEEFAIHASSGICDERMKQHGLRDQVIRDAGLSPMNFAEHRGCILGFALVAAIEQSEGWVPFGWWPEGMDPDDRNTWREREYLLGNFSEGRTLYKLTGVSRLLRPVRARGAQGPWQVPQDVYDQIRAAPRTRARA